MLQTTTKLTQLFNDNPAISVWIVGGYVRDRLLGIQSKDHDFVVVGATPKQMIDCGFQKVGSDFPVFLNEIGDEYALARTERKVGSGYNGFEVDYNPSVTLAEDLSRRDLTINAMARQVLSWNEHGHAELSDNIVDLFGGQQDLVNRTLRHTSGAFSEDPLRVLRAARFAARYNFSIDSNTMQLMKDLVEQGEMQHLTVERVWVESEKAMSEDCPWIYFEVLHKCGALEILFPQLEVVDTGPLRKVVYRNGTTLERWMALCVNIKDLNSHNVLNMLNDLKAPNDIIKNATAFIGCFYEMQHEKNSNQLICLSDIPHIMMYFLNALDAYRNPQVFQNCVHVADMIGGNIKLFMDNYIHAYHVTKNISFGNLSKLQQKRLHGQQIRDAIDQLKIQAIQKSFK